jgi:hypothetical protein
MILCSLTYGALSIAGPQKEEIGNKLNMEKLYIVRDSYLKNIDTVL